VNEDEEAGIKRRVCDPREASCFHYHCYVCILYGIVFLVRSFNSVASLPLVKYSAIRVLVARV
jgi:hypothetical protein